MSNPGAALLEVIIAMTLLSVGGLNVAALIRNAANHMEVSHRREVEIREASRFMHAVALWPREDLNRRLGRRQQGAWHLRVNRISEYLFELELTSADSTILIRTAVFRPR